MGEIIIDDEPAGVKIIGHQDPVCLQVGSDKNIDLLKCHNRCGNQNWVHSVEAVSQVPIHNFFVFNFAIRN